MKCKVFLMVSVLSVGISLKLFGQCASVSNIYSFSFNGKNYEIVKEQKTWTEAAACAVERGGYLVQINDSAEQVAVWDALHSGAGISHTYTSVSDGGGSAYVWIGATDKVSEGIWLWDGNNDSTGVNFWNGQGNAGAGGGSPAGGAYVNWGGSRAGNIKEPDNYANAQDAAAMGLTGWPSGTTTLGDTAEWNDININNNLYFVIEYDSAGSGKSENFMPPVKDIRIYPNPLTGSLALNITGGLDRIETLTIFAMNGALIFHESRPFTDQISFDAVSCKSGLYLVCMKMDDGRDVIRRLIID